MTTHLMFDGRVQLYKRGNGRLWQCAARLTGTGRTYEPADDLVGGPYPARYTRPHKRLWRNW